MKVHNGIKLMNYPFEIFAFNKFKKKDKFLGEKPNIAIVSLIF
jgi:hypothetical protein